MANKYYYYHLTRKLSNGATLSHEVPIEKFKKDHLSKPFNPIIANMFYKAGFVESWGKGNNNIVNDCLKMNLPEPDYKYTQHAVQVFLYKTPQKATQETTKDKIIKLLNQNNRYTKKDLMKILNKGDSTIKEHLNRLKRDGIIEHKGSTKAGYWKVLDDI